jgi:hypothetical protein
MWPRAGTTDLACPNSRAPPADKAGVRPRVLERETGIEPASPAWKAGTLPLSYSRDAGASLRRGPKRPAGSSRTSAATPAFILTKWPRDRVRRSSRTAASRPGRAGESSDGGAALRVGRERIREAERQNGAHRGRGSLHGGRCSEPVSRSRRRRCDLDPPASLLRGELAIVAGADEQPRRNEAARAVGHVDKIPARFVVAPFPRTGETLHRGRTVLTQSHGTLLRHSPGVIVYAPLAARPDIGTTMVGREGFEPPKAFRQLIYSQPPLAAWVPPPEDVASGRPNAPRRTVSIVGRIRQRCQCDEVPQNYRHRSEDCGRKNAGHRRPGGNAGPLGGREYAASRRRYRLASRPAR